MNTYLMQFLLTPSLKRQYKWRCNIASLLRMSLIFVVIFSIIFNGIVFFILFLVISPVLFTAGEVLERHNFYVFDKLSLGQMQLLRGKENEKLYENYYNHLIVAQRKMKKKSSSFMFFHIAAYVCSVLGIVFRYVHYYTMGGIFAVSVLLGVTIMYILSSSINVKIRRAFYQATKNEMNKLYPWNGNIIPVDIDKTLKVQFHYMFKNETNFKKVWRLSFAGQLLALITGTILVLFMGILTILGGIKLLPIIGWPIIVAAVIAAIILNFLKWRFIKAEQKTYDLKNSVDATRKQIYEKCSAFTTKWNIFFAIAISMALAIVILCSFISNLFLVDIWGLISIFCFFAILIFSIILYYRDYQKTRQDVRYLERTIDLLACIDEDSAEVNEIKNIIVEGYNIKIE